MSKLSVVIQAGGKSTRMGQDKGLMPFLNTTMIQYILQQVAEMGEETIIISNNVENYKDLGYPVYPDVIPNWGALGGLYSALFHASYKTVLLLACDMPIIKTALLQHLISLSGEYDAVIPRLNSSEFAEPFRAVYKKSCLGPIMSAINAGQRRVISFFEEVDIRFVERKEVLVFDPDLVSFMNANTPKDIKTIEKIAKKL